MFLVNQAFLVAVGQGSTHSGLWVSRTSLVFGKQKIWQDLAWEVAWNVCLNPHRMSGLSLYHTRLDPWPGVAPCKSLPGWLNVLKTWPGITGVTISWPACLLQSCCPLRIIVFCQGQDRMGLNGGDNHGVVCGQSHSACTPTMIVIVWPTSNIAWTHA